MKKRLSITFILVFCAYSLFGQSHAVDTDNTIFLLNVESMPEFSGGIQKLNGLINIEIDKKTAIEKHKSNIPVYLLIEKDGSVNISESYVGFQSLSPDTKRMILNAFKNLPKWIPGEIYGKKVRVRLENVFLQVNIPRNSFSEEDEFINLNDSLPEPLIGYPSYYKLLEKSRDKTIKSKGWAYVSAIVEKDGNLTNIKIKKGLNSKANAEALRLVSNGQIWKPARRENYRVRMQVNIPINFD